MASAEQRSHQTARNRDQQRHHKQVSREHKGNPGFAHSPQIDDGDDEENSDADRHRVRQKRRSRGNQRTYARRNPHRGGKNVVRKQRRSSQQTRKRSEVVARHGVGSAARGIGGNRLAVGKINNDQQRDDRRADRYNVLHAQKPKRNQQTERRFRSISRRAEPV